MPIEHVYNTAVPSYTTSEVTSVPAQTSSVSFLKENSHRAGAIVHNDSTATLFLKLGEEASATSYSARIVANGSYELTLPYPGPIDGCWASGTSGAARITELTARI